MNTEQLIQSIGPVIGSVLLSGLCGFGNVHAGRYLSCDPCYVLPSEKWTTFLQDLYKLRNDDNKEEWHLHMRNGWQPVFHEGGIIMARHTGGDGVGFMGLCTDSGINAVIPFHMLDSDLASECEVLLKDMDEELNIARP